MQFSKELRPRVLAGEIDLTVRGWQRAQVKVGGRYRVGPGMVEVGTIDLLPFAAIDEDDVRRCGDSDREALRIRAAHSAPIHDDTPVYRIEFHVIDETSVDEA